MMRLLTAVLFIGLELTSAKWVLAAKLNVSPQTTQDSRILLSGKAPVEMKWVRVTVEKIGGPADSEVYFYKNTKKGFSTTLTLSSGSGDYKISAHSSKTKKSPNYQLFGQRIVTNAYIQPAIIQAVSQDTASAPLDLYSAGVEVDPIGSSSRFRIHGKVDPSMSWVALKIKKTGAQKETTLYTLPIQGSFSKDIDLIDGPGKYEISVLENTNLLNTHGFHSVSKITLENTDSSEPRSLSVSPISEDGFVTLKGSFYSPNTKMVFIRIAKAGKLLASKAYYIDLSNPTQEHTALSKASQDLGVEFKNMEVPKGSIFRMFEMPEWVGKYQIKVFAKDSSERDGLDYSLMDTLYVTRTKGKESNRKPPPLKSDNEIEHLLQTISPGKILVTPEATQNSLFSVYGSVPPDTNWVMIRSKKKGASEEKDTFAPAKGGKFFKEVELYDVGSFDIQVFTSAAPTQAAMYYEKAKLSVTNTDPRGFREIRIPSDSTRNSSMLIEGFVPSENRKIWIRSVLESDNADGDNKITTLDQYFLDTEPDGFFSKKIYFRHGHGRYQVVVYAAVQGPNDYYVQKTFVIDNKDRVDRSWLLPTEMVESDDEYVIQKSHHILRNFARNMNPPKTPETLTTIEKITAIHDWVGRNVRYDVPGFVHKTYKELSALDVLAPDEKGWRIAVCTGYSNLAAAFLRAQNIRARVVYGMTKKPQDSWPSEEALAKMTPEQKLTHAWSEVNTTAFVETSFEQDGSNAQVTAGMVDGEWIIMDVTWDAGSSDLQSEQFEFYEKPSHQYFQPIDIKKDHLRLDISEER